MLVGVYLLFLLFVRLFIGFVLILLCCNSVVSDYYFYIMVMHFIRLFVLVLKLVVLGRLGGDLVDVVVVVVVGW